MKVDVGRVKDNAVEVFVSYSHRDAELREALETHLALLKYQGLIRLWHDRRITAGEEWDGKIHEYLERADVVLLLVSSDFLASDYCYGVEMERALERHENGEARVIPIILRPVDWKSSRLGKLLALPTDGEPVTSWDDPDAALADVARGLRTVIEEMATRRGPNPFSQTLAIRESARFVGREAELRKLRALLDGGSVAMVGPSKMGKSSLLWSLVRGWDGDVLGPFDLQDFEDAEDFFVELGEALGVSQGRWRGIRGELRQRQALLLLDELDSGPGRCLESDHLGRFRALCNQNSGFKLVTVSRTAVKSFFPDTKQGSASYSFLQPMVLDLLSAAAARELVRHPWVEGPASFDEAMVEELVEFAGPHPFKLQRAAYHRYGALDEPGLDWRAAWRRDMEHML